MLKWTASIETRIGKISEAYFQLENLELRTIKKIAEFNFVVYPDRADADDKNTKPLHNSDLKCKTSFMLHRDDYERLADAIAEGKLIDELKRLILKSMGDGVKWIE